MIAKQLNNKMNQYGIRIEVIGRNSKQSRAALEAASRVWDRESRCIEKWIGFISLETTEWIDGIVELPGGYIEQFVKHLKQAARKATRKPCRVRVVFKYLGRSKNTRSRRDPMELEQNIWKAKKK